jgi:cell wall-associated NlpC family hydrolase
MLNLRPYLDIPYKHLGRDHSGCDCLGFEILFYREVLGRIIPDIAEQYSSHWQGENKDFFLQTYHKRFTRIDRPGLYDIIAFKNKHGIVNHSGIVLGYNKFIHCCEDGVMVDSYTRLMWEKRFSGFYRLNNEN